MSSRNSKILSITLLSLLGASIADYSYIQGGNDWQDTCNTGKHQSPIDIPTSLLREKTTNVGSLEYTNDFDFYTSYLNIS